MRDESAELLNRQNDFCTKILPLQRSLHTFALQLASHIADDLVQDTLERAWRFWPPAHQIALKAWLFLMCKRLYINQYRREQRASRGLSASAHLTRILAHPEEAPAAVIQATPERFFSDPVLAAYQTLSPIRQDLAVSVDISDASYKHVAARLHIPTGTVMSSLFRTRKLLRDALATERNLSPAAR